MRALDKNKRQPDYLCTNKFEKYSLKDRQAGGDETVQSLTITVLR
jgi:hypothetical protein